MIKGCSYVTIMGYRVFPFYIMMQKEASKTTYNAHFIPRLHYKVPFNALYRENGFVYLENSKQSALKGTF